MFCHLHLLVCTIWHPQETQLLTIWQVWHLQINLWGLWESRGTFSSPTNFDESQDDTIDLLPLLVLAFVLASAFCVSFRLVSSSLNAQPSGGRTDLCPCMHPSCQNSWEQGLDCLCSFQTMCHQMGPPIHLNRSSLISAPKFLSINSIHSHDLPHSPGWQKTCWSVYELQHLSLPIFQLFQTKNIAITSQKKEENHWKEKQLDS